MAKEIDETKHLQNKYIETQALHRNEVTLEVEGIEDYNHNSPKMDYGELMIEETFSKHMAKN